MTNYHPMTKRTKIIILLLLITLLAAGGYYIWRKKQIKADIVPTLNTKTPVLTVYGTVTWGDGSPASNITVFVGPMGAQTDAKGHYLKDLVLGDLIDLTSNTLKTLYFSFADQKLTTWYAPTVGSVEAPALSLPPELSPFTNVALYRSASGSTSVTTMPTQRDFILQRQQGN